MSSQSTITFTTNLILFEIVSNYFITIVNKNFTKFYNQV